MNNTSRPDPNSIAFTCTCAEAIRDGVLLDVSPLAREAGFQIPVALAVGLWAAYGAPDKTPVGDQGTVWNILWMLRCAAIGILPAKLDRHPHGETLWFELGLTPRGKTQPELVLLKAISGGGDDGEPLLTIVLPHED